MSGLEIDFVLYQGDPDEGASSIASPELLKPDVAYTGEDLTRAYGAVTVSKSGKALIELYPDPIFKLVSHMVRAVHSLIEGEAETIGFTESEYGFLFEPSGEDVMVSFFSGDPFEPDEYLLTEEQLPLEAFSSQILGMGERLRDIVKKTDKDLFDRDEYSKSLIEFLEMSKDTFTSFKREKERGLR